MRAVNHGLEQDDSYQMIPAVEDEGQIMAVPKRKGKLLDGFLLLYSCRVRLPHEAIKSRLTNQKIVDVIEEDMTYFKSLSFLDVSDNELGIDQLKNLVGLRELVMAYNSISSIMISDGMFPNLETLNLSYNQIPCSQLPILGRLERL